MVRRARSQLVSVCHQIRPPDNLGSIARLLANDVRKRWVLSDPVTMDLRAAEKMAVGAEKLLRGVAVAKDLPEAVRDCVYAVGTTSREVKGRVMLSPAQAMEKLRENASRGPVALVLGGEKRGLSDEELACCTDVAAISTQPEQPSLNVSQAAAIFFWLWAQVEKPRTLPLPRVPGWRPCKPSKRS